MGFSSFVKGEKAGGKATQKRQIIKTSDAVCFF